MLLPLDTSLNVAWVAISVVFLAVLLRADFRRNKESSWRRLRRIAAVSLLALALFPSISVSDDEVCLWFLFSHTSRRGSVATPVEESRDASTAQHLAHVVNSLENCRLAGVWVLPFSPLFVTFVLVTVFTPRERFRRIRIARAPPVL